MKAHRHLILISGVLIAISAALVPVSASELATAVAPAACDLRLDVVLTPDVPNPADLGFLSSLLSNQPGYQLTLRRPERESVLVLELSGPGPDSRCRGVIETMRRDARVISVHVERESASATTVAAAQTDSISDEAPTVGDDTPSVAIITLSGQPEPTASPHLSLAGIGSLYWGIAHPAQAWKVLAPLQPDDAAYSDIQVSCAASAPAATRAAACP